MVVGRLHHVVLDCPDPDALARFYGKLLGLTVTHTSIDWIVIAKRENTSGIAFQHAPDHQPPEWGDPTQPQQAHFDVMVDDLSIAEARVAAMGARKLASEPVSVWADPAGHHFCLVPRPPWADPIAQPSS